MNITGQLEQFVVRDDARTVLADFQFDEYLDGRGRCGKNLGQLIDLFEFQTALSGELYGIDAFDQPGVEAGKVAAYALMGREGYAKQAARLRRELSRRRAVV